MRRIAIKSFALILTFFLFGLSKPDLSIVPQCADISINRVYFQYPASVENVLGKYLKLVRDQKVDFSYVRFYSQDKTESFTLFSHPGNYINDFSEFEIKEVSKNARNAHGHVTRFAHFVSGKGIRLGMDKNQVVKILGKGFTSELMKNKTEVLKYRIDMDKFPKASQEGRFLAFYGSPAYYGTYKFRDNKLIEFIFGFEYP